MSRLQVILQKDQPTFDDWLIERDYRWLLQDYARGAETFAPRREYIGSKYHQLGVDLMNDLWALEQHYRDNGFNYMKGLQSANEAWLQRYFDR